MKILVDNSVLRDAVVGQWGKQPHSVQWGGLEVKTEVAVMTPRSLPPIDQVARRQAVLALPTIARLAREGAFDLVTYEELNWERVHGRNPAVATRGDLFANVEIPHVEPAVSRSFFRRSALDSYWKKEALTEFCKALLEMDAASANLAAARRNLPAMSVQSLIAIGRFKEICKGASDKHLTDLFHIWTGERNECSYFLTMEVRITNWIRGRKNIQILCEPIRPDELLTKLGIAELDPMPILEGGALEYFRAVDLDQS